MVVKREPKKNNHKSNEHAVNNVQCSIITLSVLAFLIYFIFTVTNFGNETEQLIEVIEQILECVNCGPTVVQLNTFYR